jgi:hypothetical protein
MPKILKRSLSYIYLASLMTVYGCGSTTTLILPEKTPVKVQAAIKPAADSPSLAIIQKTKKLEKQAKLILTANLKPSEIEQKSPEKMMSFLYSRMMSRKELKRSIDSLKDSRRLIYLVRKYNKDHEIDSVNSKAQMISDIAEIESMFGEPENAWQLTKEAFSYDHKPILTYTLYAHFLVLQGKDDEAEKVRQQLLRERGNESEVLHSTYLKVLLSRPDAKQLNTSR